MVEAVAVARSIKHILGAARLCKVAVLTLMGLCGCGEDRAAKEAPDEGELLRVGSVIVRQSDLDYQLEEHHGGRTDEGTRSAALEELKSRAMWVQAALDSGLAEDPMFRAESARLLAARLKEIELDPQLKAAYQPVPEARLRELYKENESRFRSNEKRQVAVLWLNPNQDPERLKAYQERLSTAREFLMDNEAIREHPDQGFSVLSVDYSEHAASRYKGGVVGWLEVEGGMDSWFRAVAEMVFLLKKKGDVSEVLSRPEGVFLVRYMDQIPTVLSPFESVRAELERAEQQRLAQVMEAEFDARIQATLPMDDMKKWESRRSEAGAVPTGSGGIAE